MRQGGRLQKVGGSARRREAGRKDIAAPGKKAARREGERLGETAGGWALESRCAWPEGGKAWRSNRNRFFRQKAAPHNSVTRAKEARATSPR